MSITPTGPNLIKNVCDQKHSAADDAFSNTHDRSTSAMTTDQITFSDQNGKRDDYRAVISNIGAATLSATQGIGQKAAGGADNLLSVGSKLLGTLGDVAGLGFGVAGLVVTTQSAAGNVGEDAPNAAWRETSDAISDRTPPSTHTAYPDARQNEGPPTHTSLPSTAPRAKADSVNITPLATPTRPSHTGHVNQHNERAHKPGGFVINQPKATDYALFHKTPQATSQHLEHLAPGGTLANADRAIVPVAKLSGYALNPDHETGGNKARVFQAALGMETSHASDLERQLREGIKTHAAIPGDVDENGVRFAVDVPVVGPKGTAVVRSSWIYKPGSDDPSLTSARVKVK